MTNKELALHAVLSNLKEISCSNGVHHCICPCHDDNKPSLDIALGNIKVVGDCKAGCKHSDIANKIGVPQEQWYYDYYDKKQDGFNSFQYKEKWKMYIESREKRKIEAVYPYVSINGGYAFHKIRLEGKKILYGRLENERFSYGLQRSKPRKSYRAIYGDLNAIQKAIKCGKPVLIPEGEKDVDTLKKHGFVAFTYGGVNDWQSEFASILKDAVVYILADNDIPGQSVANRIYADLQGIVKTANIITPMPDIPKADITDYFESGKTNADFEKLINNAVTSNRIEGKKAPKKTLESTLKEIHAENYETSDKGNARLFADIFKDKHRYCSTRKDFMLFDGKRWIDDLEGLSARKSAKELSDALIRYAVTVDTDGKYLKAVTPLCNLRNRNNMLQDSRDLSYFTNEQLDVNDYILNVQNGTLDLSGDKPIFMEHSPDMLLSKICNVNYEPSAKCEVWEKFINEIMQNDKSKIEYLQKIAGLSLTGNTSEETAFILYGSTTRNGKSTFCETLIYLLGDYALTMRPETLATKQNTDSRQANGDVARLCGCRFVNASEPPKRMLFDTALLKSLLGRDSITARFLHQREFEFIPKFKLVINTNYLPVITDDTIFSSGRLNVVSFDRHFEPHEQDKHLKDKLRRKEELSGILNWCLEGLRLYRKDGLKAPEAVQKATNAYRADSDKIGNFINECLKKTDTNSKAKEIYDCYVKWCSDNGYGIENKGNFFAEMKNKGLFATSGTVTGKTVKNVIKGYVIDTDFQTVNDDSEIPFC